MNAAQEWKAVLQEAAKAALLLALLERLCLTRNATWLEAWIDYASLQALMFKRGSLTVVQQTRIMLTHTKRLSD